MRKLASFVLVAALLMALPVFAQDETTITYDEVITGEITNDAPEISYTFEGSAGDTIAISMTATPGQFDTYLRLLDTDGEEITINDDSNGTLNSMLGPVTLPDDGTYTIVATRCCPPNNTGNGSTGSFELVIREAELTTLAVDETVTVSVNDETPNVYFSFDGSSAQSQYYNLVAETIEGEANFLIGVLNPNGQIVNQAWQNNNEPVYLDPLLLNIDGPYIINVSRVPTDANGDPVTAPVTMSFTLQELETQPFSVGDTVSGLLNDDNPSDHYTFSGTQDDLLRLIGSQSDENAPFEVMIFAPGGYNINGLNTFYQENPDSAVLDPIQLPVSGDYLVVVRRLNPEGTGELEPTEYSLTLTLSEAPTLELGVAVENSLGGQTYEQVYRYNGTEGETIRITLQGTSENYAPGLSVQGPSTDTDTVGGSNNFYLNMGSNTPGKLIYEVTLPLDGVYLFRVNTGMYDTEGPLQGSFSLMIEAVE